MAGNIKVIKPGKNYEQVSKAVIFDNRLDLATLGLFCKVISLSDKWQLNVSGLATLMNVSTGKIQKCLAQLEECGYLKREKVQGERGRFCGWDYTFYNLPLDTDNANHRRSENTDVGESRLSENGEVYNKTIKNNKHISSIKDNKGIGDKSAPAKIEYAPKVFLTENEHAKLVMHYGTDGADAMIQKLSIHKGANGKSYKSDYLAILNWVVDWWQKQTKNPLPNSATPSPSGKTSTLEHNLNTLAQLGINPIQGTEADFDF